jgi:ATPase subunit of ABC transporter with duplicated ATPase domains
MERLTRKQQASIAALLSYRTIEEAAQASKVGKTTLFRWFQDEAFQDSYRKARSEVVRHAIVQAQSSCSEAVNVLREIMNSTESPASTRVSAAKAVIETSIKAVEIEDIEKRLDDLERNMKNESSRRHR